MINFFLVVISLYYIFKDSDQFLGKVRQAIPLAPEDREMLFERLEEMVYATLYGGIFVAILQGFLGGVAFWFLGVSAPIFWGTIMAFLSFLPVVGPVCVWGPVVIYFFPDDLGSGRGGPIGQFPAPDAHQQEDEAPYYSVVFRGAWGSEGLRTTGAHCGPLGGNHLHYDPRYLFGKSGSTNLIGNVRNLEAMYEKGVDLFSSLRHPHWMRKSDQGGEGVREGHGPSGAGGYPLLRE
jgi:hypothetical protein